MAEQTLTAYLTEIADAIREVEMTEEEIPAPDFPERIKRIPVSLVIIELNAVIERAMAAKAEVQTSDSGGSDLPNYTRYVTSEQMSTFDAAIQAAETAKREGTTPEQVEEAIPVLEDAIAAFTGQIEIAFTPPEDIADASWEDIELLSALAAKSPQDYAKYLGQEKTFTYGGFNVTARIVGCSQDDRAAGGKVGFTFEIYRGIDTHNMNSSNTTAGGYASSAMKTYIDGLAFPADLQPLLQEFVVHYRDGSNVNTAAKTLNAKAALMSARNMYWPGCQGENGYDSYFWEDEGPTYQYFTNNDTLQARTHYNNSGRANGAWLLSPYDATLFMRADSSGYASNGSASGACVPAVRFCLGSSI